LQRPGTAKGFVFLSLEDETGVSNVIVNPDLYEKYRVVINREKFLRVEGVLQNQDHTILLTTLAICAFLSPLSGAAGKRTAKPILRVAADGLPGGHDTP